MQLSTDRKAGFWIRLLATWLDCIIVYLFLTSIFYLLLFTSTYIYFPFNFTFFIVGIIYSSVLVALKGQTIGKYLMGIVVYNDDNTRLSPVKSFLRESVLKILSGIVLFLGFFWIGFSKKKMGWHDYLARSKVLQYEEQKTITYFWKTIALTSFLLFFGNYTWNFTSVIIDAKKISLSPAAVKLPFMGREPSAVMDVSSTPDSALVNWLNKNELAPEDYVLQAAATHQITILGEEHENRNNLIFLNKLIQPLYFRSGVRVIALEVIPASMNKKVDELLNKKFYDTTLAREIARSQCWQAWGYKEYWDVMESVWNLDHSLPEGAPRMKIVGIDVEWMMPDFSLLNISGDSKGKSAFWEKFRIFSIIEDLPKIVYRDELMARNLERGVIDKNQKAVVLIGFNHTPLNFAYPITKNNKVIAARPRFGVLLNNKYPGKFFQIELFHRLDLSENSTICKSSIDDLLDSVMRKRNYQPVGFTISSSPFAKLRDSCSMFFSGSPSICYGDIAQGLIFLKPFDQTKECTWLSGYISNKMFMKYKPMYELMFKHKFKNSKELNELLSRELG